MKDLDWCSTKNTDVYSLKIKLSAVLKGEYDVFYNAKKLSDSIVLGSLVPSDRETIHLLVSEQDECRCKKCAIKLSTRIRLHTKLFQKSAEEKEKHQKETHFPCCKHKKCTQTAVSFDDVQKAIDDMKREVAQENEKKLREMGQRILIVSK